MLKLTIRTDDIWIQDANTGHQYQLSKLLTPGRKVNFKIGKDTLDCEFDQVDRDLRLLVDPPKHSVRKGSGK